MLNEPLRDPHLRAHFAGSGILLDRSHLLRMFLQEVAG